jgi:hypothetical protein
VSIKEPRNRSFSIKNYSIEYTKRFQKIRHKSEMLLVCYFDLLIMAHRYKRGGEGAEQVCS